MFPRVLGKQEEKEKQKYGQGSIRTIITRGRLSLRILSSAPVEVRAHCLRPVTRNESVAATRDAVCFRNCHNIETDKQY